MLGFLKRFFAPTPTPPADDAQDRFRRLNEVAPLRAPEATAAEQPPAKPPERSFVCREAVLDRGERIAGYEFSLNRRLQDRLLVRSEMAQRVYDDALLRNLDAAGIGTLLGHRLAFVHLSPLSVGNAQLDKLRTSNVVLMLDGRAADAVDLQLVDDRLTALRANGIRHGWTLHQETPELGPALAEADFVEVEASAFDGLQLRSLASGLRKIRGGDRPAIGLIARELQTHDDFHLCFQCGFDHFHGPFVSSRENWHVPKSDINRLRVIELLNLIRSGAEFDVVSGSLKTEPVLTFKLLRYINSPAIGLQREVTSIGQGLIILGRDKFYRWLSLLLFDSRNPSYRERLLTEQALTRGRFMESLAGQGRVPNAADHLFMTGLFSLLDTLMGQTIAEMLGQVVLPDPVREALLGTPGPFRDVLRLTMAMESNNPDEIAPEADHCGIDDLAVSRAMIEALTWAQAIQAANEP